MSKLPVAQAFGNTDVVEMQPMPSPADIYKYSSAETVEHALNSDTNAVWILIPVGAQLYVAEGSSADVDADHSLPLPGGLWPLAVTPGATITCIGIDAPFDFRIQEARL